MAAPHLQFRNSVDFAEGYSINCIKEIDRNSTAYPDLAREFLISPLLTYPPNAILDTITNEFNSRIRDALLERDCSKLVAYVNCARGDESVEGLYGYEPWRLEKGYDPLGRFNFFAPIS